MKRGRPRDEYPNADFRGAVLATLAERSLGLRALESLSGVNRGTLSGVLHGKRPCGRQDRAAIMHALGFGPEVQSRFLPAGSAAAGECDRVLLDGRLSAHPQLQRGLVLMSRAQFSEAYREFRNVFDTSAPGTDKLLQADAAGRLAWFHGELEQFRDARRWAGVSVGLLEAYLGLNADQIIDAVNTSLTPSGACGKAAYVLSRALRVHSKVLAVRIVHHLEFTWLPEAREAFRQSLRLDERLQIPELGHDFRWKAVALSAQDRSQVRDVESLLSASRERLASGSPGEACLVREQGIIRWQKNRLAKAADLLWDAKEKLTYFADARALGPTFCVLSKVIVQDGGDFRKARRYALIAAALHPHGYVLDHCGDQLRKSPAVERQRDLDDLLAGQEPFDLVHQVMARVAQGSPNTGEQLIERSLGRIRGVLLPSAGLDSAPIQSSRLQ
ncbi:MAG TPA: hypothetical protein VGG72_20005 [Bryobacteraceae bacterium]|jgi:lambda repressor-like predicted transcriptional regulator